jgi:hypothetical protein
MDLGALVLAVPVALDGESGAANNTAIGAISVASVVAGYLVLAALWYFVFRKKAREKRDSGSGSED